MAHYRDLKVFRVFRDLKAFRGKLAHRVPRVSKALLALKVILARHLLIVCSQNSNLLI